MTHTDERTISISKIASTNDTYSVRDNSPRGCHTANANEIKIGDDVVIDNYFTTVVEDCEEPDTAEAEQDEQPEQKAIIAIYVVNLASYVEYRTRGEWLNLPATDEKIKQTLHDIGDPEEIAIHDYESEELPELHIGEYDSITKLNELAQEIADLDDCDKEKLLAILEAVTCNIKEALDAMDNYEYYGGVTLEEYAEELLDEGCFGEISDSIRNYIDVSAIARDLGFDGYTETANGVLYAC